MAKAALFLDQSESLAKENMRERRNTCPRAGFTHRHIKADQNTQNPSLSAVMGSSNGAVSSTVANSPQQRSTDLLMVNRVEQGSRGEGTGIRDVPPAHAHDSFLRSVVQRWDGPGQSELDIPDKRHLIDVDCSATTNQ